MQSQQHTRSVGMQCWQLSEPGCGHATDMLVTMAAPVPSEQQNSARLCQMCQGVPGCCHSSHLQPPNSQICQCEAASASIHPGTSPSLSAEAHG